MRYQDTSFKKDLRLESLRNAKKLIQFIIDMYNVEGIVVNGMMKIVTKITEALMFQDRLLDFTNEVGFLKIIEEAL